MKVSRALRSGMVANLVAQTDGVKPRMQAAVVARGAEARDLAKQLAPKRTGLLASSVTVAYSPERLVATLFHDPAAFAKAGLAPYGHWVEGGTTRMAARPHIGPAVDAVARRLSADAGTILKDAGRARGAGR